MFVPRTETSDFCVMVELVLAKARNTRPVYRVIRDAVAMFRAGHAEEFYRYRFTGK